jgi:uncharacterized protein YlbG (UPF0298 family)
MGNLSNFYIIYYKETHLEKLLQEIQFLSRFLEKVKIGIKPLLRQHNQNKP